MRLGLIAAMLAALVSFAAPAHADSPFHCPYPAVSMGADVLGGEGEFCDYPTEANGAHMHCEAGGFHAGGIGLAGGDIFNFGLLSNAGAGGYSCTWRCPDNSLALAPNPPGQWREKIVLTAETNDCRDHMAPAGSWSAPPPGAVPND
ncbi:hypothetical protein I5G62_gp28 [Mycobacterium phage CRB2]|uniref:Uncharacterized protein n=1 Tax=Mycobacterium phage CRB2 TaxID=2483623 RepID=A0A455LM01_9CAUD|nr:hypothetical protein I5G62_gp28 [Mycobacterium phage CRB2]AYP70014.1 hypothetical protein CRB2_28 [Mycobacterium phage CRB2]